MGADPTTLRTVMGNLATGVVVVATPGADGHGMTANAVTSVSLDPPLVLVCVRSGSRSDTAMARSGAFALSVLSADQTAAAAWFADGRRPAGARQFAVVDHRAGPRTGAPLLVGALAWLECAVARSIPVGDHVVVLGDVLEATTGVPNDPLLFHLGEFRRHELPPVLRAA